MLVLESAARTFWVQRDEDMSGMSGTGVVADGVQFPDGTTVVRWRELPKDSPNYARGVRATTVVFPNVEAVEALHGHNGATHLVWHDRMDEEGREAEAYERQITGGMSPEQLRAFHRKYADAADVNDDEKSGPHSVQSKRD